MPALGYQTSEYQDEVRAVLSQKGFSIVEDKDFARSEYKGRFLLEFVTDGVFRIQEKATVSIYQKRSAEIKYQIRFRDSKYTLGGDEFLSYMKLLKRIPSCQEIIL
jgi:hypothetical protein